MSWQRSGRMTLITQSAHATKRVSFNNVRTTHRNSKHSSWECQRYVEPFHAIFNLPDADICVESNITLTTRVAIYRKCGRLWTKNQCPTASQWSRSMGYRRGMLIMPENHCFSDHQLSRSYLAAYCRLRVRCIQTPLLYNFIHINGNDRRIHYRPAMSLHHVNKTT